ncbi:glycosyl hydrolase family 18 protein [Paenibacillus sp. BSR1-1]|uniref:glycoside hydrolase family 18 protein n=1 Tax=Paenibacillus sp. BSR1-1 TaxID=3020845 RepID=UPI0025B24BAF|nr:glycosyl hydrolase family 18 protein [Paenibacillus sp. BSR1-1]MDN3016436.1 glycosyl hydrolase family 18 protein [Paenibacillus sp. BSR1-1]
MKKKLSYIILVFLVLLSFLPNGQAALAAKPDRTAPTSPTNLHTTSITETTVSLAWNSSTDNVGVTGYDIYQNNSLIGNVSSTQYVANNLTPNTSYSFYIKARDARGNISAASSTLNVVTLPQTTPVQSNYKRVGYFAGWASYSNYQVSDIDASKLTHLNYAFANINADGKIEVGDPSVDIEKTFPGDTADQPYKGNFYQLTKLKQQYPQLKTLISVGGWSWSERFSDVALTDQSRTIFADSCLQFILKYGFDGIDLDWEYPVSGGEAGNIHRPEDKQNFTLLVKKIRETLDAQSAIDGKKYLLTIAGGANKGYVANTELSLLQQYLDYIQLMTYDFHGSWDTLTGMNSPLYRDPESKFAEFSVQDAVQTYINSGVPAAKLVMGIPFYGRVYNQVNNVNNGLYQSFTGGGSALSYGQLEASYLNKNGFIRYWEPDSKVPWLFNGSQFISYDDPESIGYKTSFIKSMGLGGAMMWELSQDPNKVLISKIYNDLR